MVQVFLCSGAILIKIILIKKNSCNVFYHPCIDNLSQKQRDLINFHIGKAIDIIKDNTEKEEL